MSDLVERLRHISENYGDEYLDELSGRAAARIEQLEAALRAWESAVRVDVLMEGPRYMGVSRGAGERAWKMTRAALGEK